MTASADLVAIRDLGRRDVAAWRELAEQAIVPNPFSHPDFVLAAIDGLGQTDVGLLIARSGGGGGEWHAALPVHHVNRWRHIPGRRLATWLHPYCFLGTPLLHPLITPDALAGLIARAVREHGHGFAIDLTDATGPAASVLDAALDLHGPALRFAAMQRAALHRRPENDYLATNVSARHRKEFRRQRRRLETRFGSPLAVSDRAGEAGGATRFLKLEAAGWKGQAGTAMACDAGHARFFVALCDAWAAQGRLEILFLEAADRPLAAVANLVADDGVFLFKIAFDEELATFSPGVQLVLDMIGRFHEDTCAQWVDSCADPGNTMINRLFSQRRTLNAVFVSSRGPRGAIGHRALSAAHRLRSASRSPANELATDD